MNLQTCRRHPGPRFLRTCPGCSQELYDIEAANRAKTSTTFKAGQRVTVADGSTQIVAKMLHMPGEPDRVEVEAGPAWLASECELAPAPNHGDLVRCEAHEGRHLEVPGCVWPHLVGASGVEPRVGHPYRSCD